VNARHVEHRGGNLLDRLGRHGIHRRASAEAFERLGQRAVQRPVIDVGCSVQHGLGQLLLHRIYEDIDARRLLALIVGPRGQKLPDWQLDRRRSGVRHPLP